jgi:hypothetical protein
MSLIVAAYNNNHLVIGTESLSIYTKDGKPHTPEDGEVVKVTEVNSQLALMLTGIYMSDKREFVRRFQGIVGSVTDLDVAFARLYEMGQRGMTVHRGEAFMMGLAGFTLAGPSFRLITQEHGQAMGYVKDYPYNYYLNGEEDAVKYAERQIKAHNITSRTSTIEIQVLLQAIIEACIDQYPQKLGGPVVFATLSKVAGNLPMICFVIYKAYTSINTRELRFAQVRRSD